jgi:prevent-host-death family protein
MIQPRDIHTLTDFKRKSTELLDELELSGRPHLLTVDGRPKAIMLGVEAFERLAALADQRDALEGIRRGLADVTAGRTMSLEDFERNFRERVGAKPGG